MILAAVLAATLSYAQDWGGRYTLEFSDQAVYARGELFLVPVSPDETEFYLSVEHVDGARVVYDSQDGPVKMKDGKFVWRYPLPGFDYTLTLIPSPDSDSGYPMENTVQVIEDVGGGAHPYNLDLCPDGYYTRDMARFVTHDGWMYRKNADESGCTLARGGIYSGKIALPASVKGPFGKILKVTGIDSDAFMESRGVSQVVLHDMEQRVAPGALTYTEVPYDWSKIAQPFFAYPSKAKDRFVIPFYEGFERPENIFPWVVFKQNIAPAQQSGNTIGDDNALAGRVDPAFDRTMGVFYTLQLPKTDISKMFKGYDSFEIEALVADADFVAFHTFPAFSRWKFPEKEQNASKAVENTVAKMFGRTVMYSRRAAWQRDGGGELDIVEFTHKDHQAMVVFAWVEGGSVVATASMTTMIESEFEDFSVWNVDDEGTFGIPDVVTIARDPEGVVTVYLAKNSPESVTCFALHQNGDQLEIINFDQWYRYIDL